MKKITRGLSTIFPDVLDLFFPKICCSCATETINKETILCLVCSSTLNTIETENFTNNNLTSKFSGRVVLQSGFYLFDYYKNSIVQKLIHQLKYNGREDIGQYFGELIAEIIISEKMFNEIDYIIPVPLHIKKEKKRGYNQLDEMCYTISQKTNISYDKNLVKRIENDSAQSQKGLTDRTILDKDSKFKILDSELLKNKHVMLIDDVITTGTTMEYFAKEFIKINCKVHIISISVSK